MCVCVCEQSYYARLPWSEQGPCAVLHGTGDAVSPGEVSLAQRAINISAAGPQLLNDIWSDRGVETDPDEPMNE